MYIRLVFGVILLLFSCKNTLVLLPDETLSPIFDTDPPKVKWISPRFDAVVNEVVTIICQITDKSGIATIELWVDSLQSDINSISNIDSIYTINWPIMNYNDGNTPLLFAVDFLKEYTHLLQSHCFL